jgi:hypothetical protein
MKNTNILTLYFNTTQECILRLNYTHQPCTIYGVALETLHFEIRHKQLLDIISTYQNKYQSKNDQECLYQYFEDCHVVDLREYTEAKLFTYEIEEYTNGYWLNHNIGTLDRTYFFHANHVSGKTSKMELLQKALT